MSRDEFKRLLGAGHGRAIAFLRAVTPTPYPDALLEVCVDKGCDPLFASNQADVLWEAVQKCGHAEYLRAGILDAARARTGTPRLHHYLQTLCLRFAERGDDDFRNLVRGWTHDCDPGISLTPMWGAIVADGPAGMIEVARNIGRRLRSKNAITCTPDDFFEDAESRSRAITLIREAAVAEKDVRTYVDHLERFVSGGPDEHASDAVPLPRAEGMGHEEVSRRLREKDLAPWADNEIAFMRQWARTATEVDFQRLAADVDPRTDDVGALRARLYLFTDRDFPGDPSVLIVLADDADPHVSLFAMLSLARLRHPACRDVAWRQINAGRWSCAMCELLATDLRADDMQHLLHRLSERAWDAEAVHDVSLGIASLVAAATNDSASLLPLLLWLYEQTPCPLCRVDIVKAIVVLGGMTTSIAEECLHDAECATRDAARRWLDGRG